MTALALLPELDDAMSVGLSSVVPGGLRELGSSLNEPAKRTPTLLPDLDPGMILAEAARLREVAIKDKSYRATPIGHLVGRYLDHLEFRSYSDRTVDTREQILAEFAFALAHRQPDTIIPDELQTYVEQRYGQLARNTKQSAVSTIRVFWTWAHDNDHVPTNPARRLRGPRYADTERRAHSLDTVRRLIVAQDSRRDRCALLLLYWCALRRNELRQVQFRHIDLARRVLTVFGKGGTVVEQNIPEYAALELERYIQDQGLLAERGNVDTRRPEGQTAARTAPNEDNAVAYSSAISVPPRSASRPHPDEYLLYPYHVAKRGRYPLYVEDVIWEDRRQPLSISGMDGWWRRMLKRAGLEQFPMHEIRHTAGTHFHEAGHDLKATQDFMRHASPATTARVYLHLDRVAEVARVQRVMPDPLEER